MVGSHPRRAAWAGLLAGLALAVAGCGRGGQQAGPPPPMEVDALTLVPRTVDEIVELPGRVEAVRTAEVRARVDGIVERRLYEEGTDVREGAPLFAIDPREKRASEASARAALQRAQATLGNARKDWLAIRRWSNARRSAPRNSTPPRPPYARARPTSPRPRRRLREPSSI